MWLVIWLAGTLILLIGYFLGHALGYNKGYDVGFNTKVEQYTKENDYGNHTRTVACEQDDR
jgi:hypothetical protein